MVCLVDVVVVSLQYVAVVRDAMQPLHLIGVGRVAEPNWWWVIDGLPHFLKTCLLAENGLFVDRQLFQCVFTLLVCCNIERYVWSVMCRQSVSVTV